MARVSVVIPTYNREKFLRDAIDSVLRQTFTDFEIIVVDDGSTDNTREIIKEYKDPRVKYMYQENSGVSIARNNGINSSESEYIALLDSDDMYLENMLDKSVRTLDEHPEVGFTYGQTNLMREGYGIYRTRKSPFHQDSAIVGSVEQVRELLFHSPITTSTFVGRRHYIEETGEFHTDLWLCEDYHFFVRLAKRFSGYYVAEPLTIMRIHAEQAHGIMKPGRERAFPRILSEVFDDPEVAPHCEDVKGKAYSYFYRTWILGSAYGVDNKLARSYLRKAVKYYPGIILTRQIFVMMYKYMASLLPNKLRLMLLGVKRRIFYPLERQE